MSSIILYLIFLASASVAPRLEPTPFMPWLETNDCVDGVNKVIQAADAKPGLPIQFNELEIWVYDKNGKPSCHNGRAMLTALGKVKAVKGVVSIISPFELKSSANVKFTVKKADLGTICNNGKSEILMVPGDWQSTAFLYSNGKEVAALKLPPNTERLYIYRDSFMLPNFE